MSQTVLASTQTLIVSALLVGLLFCCGILIGPEPAWATTYSLHSQGTPGEEGVLTGFVSFDPEVVQQALNNSPPNRGVSGGLSLQELGEDSDFAFEYISPYSGVKHTQDTICDRNIYDLNNGLAGNDVIGGREGPFFDFNGYELTAVDFRSCVGIKGDIHSSISDRDLELAFSELESQFSQLKLIEEDYGGRKPGRFRKKFRLELKLEKL